MTLGQLVQPVPHLDVLDHPGDDLLERRRDRAELERDLLVQGQVDADARLELCEQRRIAELVDHLHERVPDGDRPVPVDDESQELQVRGEPGLGGLVRLVPRQRVLAVVELAGELRELQWVERVAHDRQLAGLV